jgi:hypothetical protein
MQATMARSRHALGFDQNFEFWSKPRAKTRAIGARNNT